MWFELNCERQKFQEDTPQAGCAPEKWNKSGVNKKKCLRLCLEGIKGDRDPSWVEKVPTTQVRVPRVARLIDYPLF
jgi:hypothetical protein